MNVTDINSLPLLSTSSSRLISLLNTLPITDYKRILTYLDGLALIRLSQCCRWLKIKITTDNTIWQYIYNQQFLSNVALNKEWEFIEWCRRYTSSSNHNSNEQPQQQSTFSWREVYRRRVTTEMNWRHSRGRRTVIPLPEPDTYKQWSIARTSATGIILYGRYRRGQGSLCLNMVTVESAPFNNSSNGNGTSTSNESLMMPPILPTLKKLELTDKRDIDKNIIALISERFIVIVVNCFYTISSYMEIRDRGSLALRSMCQLPYRSLIQTIRERWAIFTYRESTMNKLLTPKLVVWDLECGTVCPGAIEDIGDTISVHQVDETSATIYVASLVNDAGSTVIHWSRYQFFTQQSMQLLQQSSFQINSEIITCLSSYPFDNEHIVLEVLDERHQSQFLIHPIIDDTRSCRALTEVQVPNHSAATTLVACGINCSMNGQSIVEVVDANSTLTDTQYQHQITRQQATRCKHVIGRVCVVSESSGRNQARTILMDMDKGILVRHCLPYMGLNDCVFLMTSIMYLVPGRNELVIIDYGAL